MPSKVARGRPRGRPRRGKTPFVRGSDAAIVAYLRGDEPVSYRHYFARQALYPALMQYAPQAFGQLANAAAVDSFDAFLAFLPQWLDRYGFRPEPDSGQEWLAWFTNDALQSYGEWHSSGRPGPFQIKAHAWEYGRSDDSADWLEVRSIVRLQFVSCALDDTGATQLAVMNEAEALRGLVDRFKEIVAPRLAELYAKEREHSGPLPRTVTDDMRRYVLNKFRELEAREIVAAERRRDRSVTVEQFTADEIAAVAPDDADLRTVHRSIRRAVELLEAPAFRHQTGPKPKRSLAARRA